METRARAPQLEGTASFVRLASYERRMSEGRAGPQLRFVDVQKVKVAFDHACFALDRRCLRRIHECLGSATILNFKQKNNSFDSATDRHNWIKFSPAARAASACVSKTRLQRS